MTRAAKAEALEATEKLLAALKGLWGRPDELDTDMRAAWGLTVAALKAVTRAESQGIEAVATKAIVPGHRQATRCLLDGARAENARVKAAISRATERFGNAIAALGPAGAVLKAIPPVGAVAGETNAGGLLRYANAVSAELERLPVAAVVRTDGAGGPVGQESVRGSSLSRSAQMAYAQYTSAAPNVDNRGRTPTDRQCYSWAKEHNDGDPLPGFDTWQRYVRRARKHHGAPKNTPRTGRSIGRSIVLAKDIEPPEPG